MKRETLIMGVKGEGQLLMTAFVLFVFWGFFWLPVKKKIGTIGKSFSLSRALHFPYFKKMLGFA